MPKDYISNYLCTKVTLCFHIEYTGIPCNSVPLTKLAPKSAQKTKWLPPKAPYNHGYKKLRLPCKGSASLKTTPLTQYLICAAGPANAGNDAENLACKVSYL